MTAEGERYVARAKQILAAIEDCEADVSAQATAPRGELRVACATGVGFETLVAALPAFSARYPDIRIEFSIAARRVDIVENQIDVAIRLGALPDSSLVVRRLASFRRVLCAAPSYLKRSPPIERPEDLLEHECLFSTAGENLGRWPFRDGTRIQTIQVSSRYQFDDGMACYRAAIAGVGIIRMSEEQAHRALEDGRLVPVLENEHVPDEVQLYALMPSGRQNSPKVRAFVDFLDDAYERQGWK